MRYAIKVTPFGDTIHKLPERLRVSFPEIQDDLFWNLYATAAKYSLLNATGFYNLYQSMRYIQANGLPGDIVECGCFLGGASIFLAMLRDELGLTDKTVWLSYTSEGFADYHQYTLVVSGQVIHPARHNNFQQSVRADFAEATPTSTRIIFVEGDVEDTIPVAEVRSICLLRLDTDFYPSTRAELEGLYIKLIRGGVIIIDDYGMFEGSRRATDEFLARLQSPPLLSRIDSVIWAGVKP